MDRMLYTVMSGAQQRMNQMATVSNNLANVSTTGFREQFYAMRAVPVEGDGVYPTRAGTAATTTGSNFTSGDINYTGNPLDVAMKQNAWLAVQDSSGQEAYTRRGDMQLDGNGMLTVAGMPVLGENGPIVLPENADISIGADGTISMIGAGQQPDTLVPTGKLKLVTPPQLSRMRLGDDGLFRYIGNNDQPQTLGADDAASVANGTIEGSNVSAAGAMADMIATSRLYEMQMKVISTTDQNAERANQLLSFS